MIVLLVAPALAQTLDVLLVTAEDPAMVPDVRTRLLAEGVTSVGTFDARSATPTAADLAPWDAVLVWADYAFADRVALGDALAAYADGGRGVVIAEFGLDEGSQPHGRFLPYIPLLPASQVGGAASMVVVDPSSPLLLGVGTVTVPGPSYLAGATAAEGANLVADWTQGAAMVAEWSVDGVATVVGVNLFPPSGSVYVLGWDPATDGARLLANALAFAALNLGHPVTSDLRGWAHGPCGGLVWLHSGFSTPGARQWFAYGGAGGRTVVPAGPCAGLVLPLSNPTYLTRLVADAAGNTEIPTFFPAGTCGATAVVVDRATCAVSAPFPMP